MQNLTLNDKNNSKKEFILFKLQESTYAIESKSILEISKLVNVEKPEKLPNHVVGVLEYSSFFINVIDLKSVLGQEIEKYTINNQILIVSTGETILGLVIDKVVDIKKIKAKKIQIPPYANENSFTLGLCSFDEENVIILNLNSIENIVRNSFKVENYTKPMENLFPTDIESKEILNERNIQLMKKIQIEHLSPYDDNEESITFHIEEETYCLDISYVKSFFKFKSNTNITKVPCTPSFIVGLLNVKGDFITVIDLRDYLNFGKTKIKNHSIIIILEAGEYKLGIIVDKIGQRMDITEELEKARNSNHQEGRLEIINFVRDEVVYSILLIDEMLKSEKLHI